MYFIFKKLLYQKKIKIHLYKNDKGYMGKI